MLVGDTGFEPVTSSVSGNGSGSADVRHCSFSRSTPHAVIHGRRRTPPDSTWWGYGWGTWLRGRLTDAHHVTTTAWGHVVATAPALSLLRVLGTVARSGAVCAWAAWCGDDGEHAGEGEGDAGAADESQVVGCAGVGQDGSVVVAFLVVGVLIVVGIFVVGVLVVRVLVAVVIVVASIWVGVFGGQDGDEYGRERPDEALLLLIGNSADEVGERVLAWEKASKSEYEVWRLVVDADRDGISCSCVYEIVEIVRIVEAE